MFLPGDIVQIDYYEDYEFPFFAEVLEIKGDQTHVRHVTATNDIMTFWEDSKQLKHVGVARPVYKEEPDV